MKHNKEREEREKIAQKFFSHGKRSLYDIMPRDKDDDDDSDEVKKSPSAGELGSRKLIIDGDGVSDSLMNSEIPKRRHKKPRKTKMIVGLASFVVLILGYYVFFVLPEATINITLKQKPWQYRDTLSLSVSDSKIPLQVFSEIKNAEVSLPASGSRNVSRKAHGTINVCNAFNSSAQTLVATTRFSNSKNQIFRLDKAVTVPGATIADGKIQPKCIDAAVTADASGAEYNVGPEAKWVIPGFKGTPKYDAFYGVSDKPMSGGLIGLTKVPTPADITKAKQLARENIKKVLDSVFAVKAPSEIIMIGEASGSSSSFAVLKEAVIDETDGSGNFRYFIEAKEERIAVRESDIKAIAVEKAKAAPEIGSGFELESFNLVLQLIQRIRDSKGVITGARVSVDFSGGFIQPLTEDEVKTQAAGKTEAELKNFIPTKQNFNAHITLWPFWVGRIPSNKDKIIVKIVTENIDLNNTELQEGSKPEATSTDR